MTFAASGVLIGHLAIAGACLVALLVPGWWLAGRILDRDSNPFWRLLWAAGLALIGYLTFVNLVGRLVGNSTWVAAAYFTINVAVGARLWRRWPAEVSWAPLANTWRTWMGPVVLALVLGLPQWFVAVSANYYDEAASSAIHLTAPNQFAEGVFPPRHNALPDVVIKYHYGFTMLSGTVRWLTGLSANVSIDVASTGLWLFAFLFVFFWFRELGFGRFATLWAGFASLLGGGLQWAYVQRIEAYSGVSKTPEISQLLHKWNADTGWLANLLADSQAPSLNLRNGDGSLSSLTWDIAPQFQQHAVALGLTLTVFCLALFVTWQRRPAGARVVLMAANVAAFGVLSLAHAAFGAMAATTAGLWLMATWIRRPSRDGFVRGIVFGVGVGALTLLHGGMFARGAQYGGNAVASMRHSFGYHDGGVLGFVNWNVASFGVPLLLALVAWGMHYRRRTALSPDARTLFGLVTVLAAVSWSIPQLMFYSSDTIGVEQFTEISKFFFVARLALALLSTFGLAYLIRSVHWAVLLPAFPAAALIPLAYIYTASVGADKKWIGFYRAPYFKNSIEQQMAEALGRLKKGPRNVYFDASADERRHHYLGEMFVFGGSVFTLTPSRFERTGVGYRIAEDVVAKRFVLNGRMARLQPGATEECTCAWYYVRPLEDMTAAPVLVRSRFEKLVAEGYFKSVFRAGKRELYAIVRPTADLDAGLENYWRPNIVTQPRRTQAASIEFHDFVNNRVISGSAAVALPDALRGESVQIYVGRFARDTGVRLMLGRMEDTEFRLGNRIEDNYEQSGWKWTSQSTATAGWQPEYRFGAWDFAIPVVADIGGAGIDSRLLFQPNTGQWLAFPDVGLKASSARRADRPVPFGGRFLEGSRGDLGVWNLAAGTVTLSSVATNREVTFRWGGRTGDVLVPGDYDGDGADEIAVWQRTNHTWYWRHAPDGPISQATFGTATAIPVPADYDGDGRLDLAYWEPRERKIYVSYTRGRTVGRVIAVPPGSIPAYVNMY
jgi:hypothetical protein